MQENKHNSRLYGMRCYLCGSIDKADDRGVEWRSRLTPFLERMGIIVLNPCKKPINIGIEDEASIIKRRECVKNEMFDELSKDMYLIRHIDLRLVDLSDFIIVNLDLDILACGTHEEIGWANRQMKPVIVRVPQGLDEVPYWLWGMLPKEQIFQTWIDLKNYLKHVHCDDNVDDLGRWVFFDYKQMVPKVNIEEASNTFSE